MKSTVVKRSIVVGGHKTSVSLEEPFWTSMKEISQQLRVTLSELVSEIDRNRQQSNLSSASSCSTIAGPTGESAPRADHALGLAESPVERG